jgi:hypothetical protein
MTAPDRFPAAPRADEVRVALPVTVTPIPFGIRIESLFPNASGLLLPAIAISRGAEAAEKGVQA